MEQYSCRQIYRRKMDHLTTVHIITFMYICVFLVPCSGHLRPLYMREMILLQVEALIMTEFLSHRLLFRVSALLGGLFLPSPPPQQQWRAWCAWSCSNWSRVTRRSAPTAQLTSTWLYSTLSCPSQAARRALKWVAAFFIAPTKLRQRLQGF